MRLEGASWALQIGRVTTMTHAHLIKALGCLAQRTRTGRKGLRLGEITSCVFQARITVYPTPHQL